MGALLIYGMIAIWLFGREFSDHTAKDLLALPTSRTTIVFAAFAQVIQPALVIASRTDRSVPFTHAESLTATIPRAELLESRADGHMIWFAPDFPAIAGKIEDFLTAAWVSAHPFFGP